MDKNILYGTCVAGGATTVSNFDAINSFDTSGNSTWTSEASVSVWKKSVVSVDEFDDRIEVVYKYEAHYSITIGFSTTTPTRVWKEIIRPNGSGFSKETIEGTYVPSQYISEQFNF